MTSLQYLVQDNSTLANFKNWAQAISNFMATIGWVQTADTGQVNWGTIVSVPGSGLFVYEIWHPSDALQTGSSQFFLRIDYGNSSASGPRLKMRLGTGTDGAGNFTGFSTITFESPGSTNLAGGGATTYDCYFSGDTDRLTILMWQPQAINAWFSIERTANTDGTNNSDGAVIASGSSSSGGSNVIRSIQVLTFGGSGAANAAVAGDYPIAFDYQNLSGVFINSVPIFPVFPIYGKLGNPLKGFAFIHTQDCALGAFITTTLYSATRTYIVTNCAATAFANSKIALRFD